MKNLLVVYHSQSGNTAALAHAVAEGAKKEPVALSLKPAFEADLRDLLAADAVLFGSPENLGYMSGAIKDFFDRTFYPAQPYALNIPYGLFISAGNDGTGAVREIDRVLLGYPMKKAVEPIIVRGEIGEASLEQCAALGEAMAAGLIMGAF
jgi:multimeric flavodoxin WrbA